jgi:hypothetical protein
VSVCVKFLACLTRALFGEMGICLGDLRRALDVMNGYSGLISAVATLALALFAIYQEPFTRFFLGARLKLDARVPPPNGDKTYFYRESIRVNLITGERTPSQSKVDCYYFRLTVENTGHMEARNVEMFAKRLQKKQADGEFTDVRTFPQMNLRWSYVGKPLLEILSPKVPKKCDIACYAEFPPNLPEGHPLLDLPDDAGILEFTLETVPNSGGHFFGPGTYRLTVVLVAANVRPKETVLEIEFPGIWHDNPDDMFSTGIKIRPV